MQEIKIKYLSNKNILFAQLFALFPYIDMFFFKSTIRHLIIHSAQQLHILGQTLVFIQCIVLVLSVVVLYKNKFEGYSIFLILFGCIIFWITMFYFQVKGIYE